MSGQIVGSNPWFVRAGIAPGYILPDNPFLLTVNGAGDPARLAPNLTLEIGRQTDGSQDWHALYGMPSYGFGVSLVSFRNGFETGRPVEAYTFFSWPFARLSQRLTVTTEFGMGVSWGWNQNGKTGDSENVLGSDVNARINWGFNLRYDVTRRVALYTGIDYTHRSNGGLVQPDLGINVIGPKVTVQYSLASERPQPRHVDPPPFQPAWEFVIGGAGGVKNVVEQTSPMARTNFAAFDVTAAAQRHFYRFGKIAAGTDVMYDGSTGARIDGADREWRADPSQRWALGVYGGYEQVIGRFSVIAQVGDSVVRGFGGPNASRLYTRYGWRYNINNRLWSTFAIRANEVWRANVIEFGAGYRIRRVAARQ